MSPFLFTCEKEVEALLVLLIKSVAKAPIKDKFGEWSMRLLIAKSESLLISSPSDRVNLQQNILL